VFSESIAVPEYQPLIERWPPIKKNGETCIESAAPITISVPFTASPRRMERLGGNTNSIYKLLHDARKKLRDGLEASGFTIEDVRKAWA
jgi:hypothetical protein